MQQHLYKYLILHHQLSIPALGNFRVVFHPAYVNESTGLLFPRRPVIEFTEGASAGTDDALIGFLSVEMGIDQAAAAKELQNFSIKLLVNMVEQHFTDLYGIGKIKKEMNGQVIFYPASNLIDILPPLRLEENIKFPAKVPETSVAEMPVAASVPVYEPVLLTEKPAAIVEEPKPVSKPVTPQVTVEKTEQRPLRIPKDIKPDKQKELDELLALKNEASKITAKVVDMKPVVEEDTDATAEDTTDKWQLYAGILAGAALVAIIIHAIVSK